MVTDVMEGLRAFRQWTLRMSKSHTVTMHHVIKVYIDMLDHIDGVMPAVATITTTRMEDSYFAGSSARLQLPK